MTIHFVSFSSNASTYPKHYARPTPHFSNRKTPPKENKKFSQQVLTNVVLIHELYVGQQFSKVV